MSSSTPTPVPAPASAPAPVPAPFYGNPGSVDAASLDDFATVFFSNGVLGLIQSQVYELRRALALSSAEVLRLSGNYAYNKLLADYRRLAEDMEDLQSTFGGYLRQVDAWTLFASGEVSHARMRNPAFPGPAWTGHPYDNPPLLSPHVSHEFLAAARTEYGLMAPGPPTRPTSPASPPGPTSSPAGPPPPPPRIRPGGVLHSGVRVGPGAPPGAQRRSGWHPRPSPAHSEGMSMAGTSVGTSVAGISAGTSIAGMSHVDGYSDEGYFSGHVANVPARRIRMDKHWRVAQISNVNLSQCNKIVPIATCTVLTSIAVLHAPSVFFSASSDNASNCVLSDPTAPFLLQMRNQGAPAFIFPHNTEVWRQFPSMVPDPAYAATSEDIDRVYLPRGGHTPYFVFEVKRAISKAPREALEASGNVHYQEVIQQNQQLVQENQRLEQELLHLQ
ncbi:hypothetical protein B0H16DRAFT_1460564 [Mycena metata]|nr:hypothetical protein B0H16DRAFT_1460564 [Mycena metata]